MKLNKKGIASSSIIIVILLVLLVGSVGYICYDKFIKADEVKPAPTEEVKKLSEEEVKKIYDTIVYEENNTIEYGLYYKEKVDSSNMMPFVVLALRNYVNEKNITISSFAYDNSNIIGVTPSEDVIYKLDEMTESQGKITKENIINYIKTKYGVEVTKNQITDGTLKSLNIIKDFGDYIVIGHMSAGGSAGQLYRSMTKYEQNDKDLVIYDNAVYRVDDTGTTAIMTYISSSSEDAVERYDWEKTSSAEIENYAKQALTNGKAGSYKHTFTLGEDNTYHWVSSEKIN